MENLFNTIDIKTKSSEVSSTAKIIYSFFGALRDTQTDIRFYDINITINDILAYADTKGFKILEFSKETKPNFSEYGYHNGYIWVYNPNQLDNSFHDVDYTRKWRYIHELAHGLTHQTILDKYNIETVNRGIGALSLEDAEIALDWETYTLALQYEIIEQLSGGGISDTARNQETNTLLADLTNRCITGDFLNPDKDGFIPYKGSLTSSWLDKVKKIYEVLIYPVECKLVIEKREQKEWTVQSAIDSLEVSELKTFEAPINQGYTVKASGYMVAKVLLDLTKDSYTIYRKEDGLNYSDMDWALLSREITRYIDSRIGRTDRLKTTNDERYTKAEYINGSDILIVDKLYNNIKYVSSEGVSVHPDEKHLQECLDGDRCFSSTIFHRSNGFKARRLVDDLLKYHLPEALKNTLKGIRAGWEA